MKFVLPLFLSLAIAAEAKYSSHGSLQNRRKAKAGKSKKCDKKTGKNMNFNRVATFPICTQIDAACNTDTETVAEIVVSTDDGMTLVYTDSEQENIGFVDITDPSAPAAGGVVEVGGEPTSVAVLGSIAVAGINTSEDFVNTSGALVAIDIETKAILKTWDLGGQPDSVAVSPDGKYVVIAIENERDEDLGDGAPPQMPAGYVVVVDTDDDIENWETSIVEMTGLDGVLFPEDPEPEYVAINEDNVAVVTLQENNAIVLIDLATKEVHSSFSAGVVDLVGIDTEEEKALINQTSSLDAVPREPDGVTFINDKFFVTADEGDLDGGSRGFTVFKTQTGEVVFSSGNFMDQMSAAVGHYPDGRSGNKGVEPENVAAGSYYGVDYIFVNAERAGLTFVYDASKPRKPKFKQILPTNVGPEGVYTIPQRDLFVVANEKDGRGDKMRSTISIYEYSCATAQYPTLQSKLSKKFLKGKEAESYEAPIAFGALSGLSNDPSDPNILYSVEDSFYLSSRFFTIKTDTYPAELVAATMIMDTNDVFAAVEPYGDFTAEDLAVMINEDKSVNVDPEGIAADGDGYFYIASEGRGTVGDDSRPIESLNFIFKVDSDGTIEEVITLPDDLNDIQVRFGLEGIAYHPDGYLVVCLQRAWGNYEEPLILIYELETSEWIGSVLYPLDEPESQNGGWVGLSDISYVEGSDASFYVLERDNQGYTDAAVKRIYYVDLWNLDIGADPPVTAEKILVKDLVEDDVYGEVGGLNMEKIEGMAFNGKGWWIVNDNDGIDDNSGEVQLLNLGEL